MIFKSCKILLLVLFALPVSRLNAQSTKQSPNIIFIYIDDLGYSDAGCYGKEFGANFIETPNIDRFATQSIKFTNAYTAAPICSPARAGLLTGKTPARLNFEFVTKWKKDQYNWNDTAWTSKFKERKLIPPPYTLYLPLKEKTIAEVLKPLGYATAMAGKWHLAPHYKVYNGWDPEMGPASQGFDWTADTFGAWGKPVTDSIQNMPDGEFPADELTNKAIEYVQQKHDKPFFLYVAHYYVHTPIKASLKWLIDKYKNKAKQNGLNFTESRILYAAYVESMDHYVGQLIQAIDKAGLEKNTLVVFTSDNGGMPEFAYNRPFRGSKWNLYEGGIRMPMLIRLPSQVSKNTVCNIPVSQLDFLPTFYEMITGKKYADTSIDGISFASLLSAHPSLNVNNRSFFWHFPYYHPEDDLYEKAKPEIGIEDGYISKTIPQSAIRKNQYKLIYFYNDKHTELYNLEKDASEQHDLTRQEPAKTNELKTELLQYLKHVNARLPKENASQ